MELKFLGGCQEVGKSSIFVNTGKEKFVMDHGIEVQEGRNPMQPPLNLDGVFITHAHLDHSGFTPGLYSQGYNGKTYATPATYDLTHMLLDDSLKVQKKRGMVSKFGPQDIKRMGKNERIMSFRDPHEIGSSTVEFFSAGHIPGASMVKISSRKKSLLYTGDVKFIPTDFMYGADKDVGDVDILISESTYSYKNHPDRKELKAKLLEIVESTCHNGGIALLPAFAVGRTQEILMMLKDTTFPIFVDGMGIRATHRMLSHPKSFNNPGLLREGIQAAHCIKKQPDRQEAVNGPGIIITTAGMLQGGPVSYYISQLAHRKDCKLVLTGYQVDGTAGRTLMDTGVYDNGEMNVTPQFPMEFLDFSAHTDRDHLIDFYKKVNPEKLILVHGDRTPEFAEELKGMGFDAYAPKNGDMLKL